MSEPAFDYRRYAPLVPPRLRPPASRPQLAWSQPDIPPRPNELAQLLGVIGNSVSLIWHSLHLIRGVLWSRLIAWVKARYLHSLTSAWATAGVGWGGCITFCVALYFTR